MTTRQTIEDLVSLGFRLPLAELEAFFKDIGKQKLSATPSISRLAHLERKERERRNLMQRSRAATLGRLVPLDSFDWNWPRKIDRNLYAHLKGLVFIKKAQNVLFRGPSGVGKTMLAQNLGLLALQTGHTVRFSTLASMLADLLKQESLPALERRMKRYTQAELLICDEIGYLPCDNRAADLLYNVVSRRHEKAATIITTNIPFKKWNTIFPGAACVSALVDRFVQHCHVLDIDADSWREKQAKLFAKQKQSTSKTDKNRKLS